MIEVSGGSLGATILATRLALEGIETKLVIPDKVSLVVPSWKSASVEGLRFNNGYHSIEAGRAPRVAHLFLLDLSMELAEDTRPAGVWVKDRLISFDADLESWPHELYDTVAMRKIHKKHLSLVTMESLLSDQGRIFFGSLSSRYGENLASGMRHFLPWFLPNTFTLDSNDEGDVYRNLLRARKIQSSRLIPKSGLFEQLAADWADILTTIGVSVVQEDSSDKWSPVRSVNRPGGAEKHFFCTVFRLTENRFNSFSEIIVADNQIAELARVSILPGPQKNLLLCESFHSVGSKPRLASFQERIEQIGDCEARLVGSELTRAMNFQAKPAKSPPTTILQEGRDTRVRFNSQGPVNMAKSSLLVDQVLAQLGEL